MARYSVSLHGLLMEGCFDDKSLKGSTIPFPFESEIGKRLVAGDICTLGPGDLNKRGDVGKTSWDSFSYTMLMAHNVYAHIRAVQRSNALADIESIECNPDYLMWRKVKRKDKSAELSKWVPRNLLYFNNFVERLFDSHKPMTMIEEAGPFLQDFNNNRIEDGHSPLFRDLFSEEANP